MCAPDIRTGNWTGGTGVQTSLKPIFFSWFPVYVSTHDFMRIHMLIHVKNWDVSINVALRTFQNIGVRLSSMVIYDLPN